MKEFDVALEVLADFPTAVELADALRVDPQQLTSRRTKQGPLWRLGSSCGGGQSLTEHLVSILARLGRRKPIRTDGAFKQIVLNIGVFHDTANCTISIPGDHLKKFLSYFPDVAVEVACYPSKN